MMSHDDDAMSPRRCLCISSELRPRAH